MAPSSGGATLKSVLTLEVIECGFLARQAAQSAHLRAPTASDLKARSPQVSNGTIDDD